MKKILFMVKQPQHAHSPLFLEAAKKLEIELVIAEYTELIITYQNNSHELFVGEHNIADFELVFFRTVGAYLEEQTLISEYCITNNIPVVDTVFNHTLPFIDRKSFEYMRLKSHLLPIIDSIFVTKKTIGFIKNNLEYPLVAKATKGARGKNVYKCNSLKELMNVFEIEQQPLLIQKFIKNDGDIRVLIIGNKVIGAIKRISSSSSEFRNNVSLGGIAIPYYLETEEVELALKASQAMQYDIAGVDLIKDNNGNVFVMEVNRAPQFSGFMRTTKIDVPYKIIEFLSKKIN